RCGRTGRGTSKGQALSFCSEGEKDLLTQIEEYTGEDITRYDLNEQDYKEILEDLDDPSYNWQKLIDQTNKEEGKEETW
ncbi:MAG: hypothetical protein RIT43_369, partial [Bacteroidota bacterium]